VLAAGRPRQLFWFSLAETLLYGGTVWLASAHGLTIVCVAVACFQIASLVLSYVILLHSTVGVARTQLIRDIGPALVASAPLLLVATVMRHLLTGVVPVPVVVILCGGVGAGVYVATLRVVSASAWADVMLLIRPMLPRLPSSLRPAKPLAGGASPVEPSRP
jgi:hypothetical protein